MRLLLFLGLALMATAGEETVTHRITGLFSKDREAGLRAAVARIPGLTLVSLDFDHAEAVFRYDPAIAFKGTPAEPAKIIERLHSELGGVSRNTFGAAPRLTTPREKIQRIEIPAAGCDCPACNLVACESISKIEGVAQATSNFREGKITALIDPEKTNRAALEDALKKRGVTLTPAGP